MIDIETYLSRLIDQLYQAFGPRLVYVGLQGSYLRGEATEYSDIDAMVVIDGLSPADLDAYRTILITLGNYEKSCGFLCSRGDLAHWNPLELFHLLHSTRDCYGTLAPLLPPYTREDARNFVKLSIGNLYHSLCHSYVHGSRKDCAAALCGAYKNVFFLLQDLHCLRQGVFVPTIAQLLPLLDGKDRALLETALRPSQSGGDLARNCELLLVWCQETLAALAVPELSPNADLP